MIYRLRLRASRKRHCSPHAPREEEAAEDRIAFAWCFITRSVMTTLFARGWFAGRGDDEGTQNATLRW